MRFNLWFVCLLAIATGCSSNTEPTVTTSTPDADPTEPPVVTGQAPTPNKTTSTDTETDAGARPAVAVVPDEPSPGSTSVTTPSKPASDEAAYKADPMKLLKACLESTQNLKTLRMIFERQSRRGLFKVLQPEERMVTEYRDNPFSVRFTWLNEDSKFWQCSYVDGKNRNRVALLERKGFLGLPPSVQNFNPNLAVLSGNARNPITDFGPRRMMERTLDRIEKAKQHGEVKITCEGLKDLGGQQCYHVVLVYPKGDQFACKLHDMYISKKSLLPMGTFLWLSDTDVRTEKTLDAKYLYSKVEANLELTDADFAIDPDRTIGKPRSEPVKAAGLDTATE